MDNEVLLLDMLQHALPDVYRVYQRMAEARMDPSVVESMIEHVDMVRQHGSGSVVVTITNGVPMVVEAKTRVVFAREEYGKKLSHQNLTIEEQRVTLA